MANSCLLTVSTLQMQSNTNNPSLKAVFPVNSQSCLCWSWAPPAENLSFFFFFFFLSLNILTSFLCLCAERLVGYQSFVYFCFRNSFMLLLETKLIKSLRVSINGKVAGHKSKTINVEFIANINNKMPRRVEGLNDNFTWNLIEPFPCIL